MMENSRYKKLFKKAEMSHREYGDFELFKKWVNSRKIIEHITYNPYSWRMVTKKGLRVGNEEYYDSMELPSDLFDHYSLWKDENGRKLITSQPYMYHPGDMDSIFAPPNIYYKEDESEKSSQEIFNRHIKWCDKRGLKIDFFKSTESWYYPRNTILIEIREKN